MTAKTVRLFAAGSGKYSQSSKWAPENKLSVLELPRPHDTFRWGGFMRMVYRMF